MDKIRLHWRNPDDIVLSNALGYSTHNKFMKKYSEQYFDYDETSDIALNITSADKFVPIPGKYNILFSMWEFFDLPQTYIRALQQADLIIVPSRFCRDLFKRYTDKPVEVCFEGVEAQNYPFYQRKFPAPGEKFRFLWVGAPNPRKGYPLVLEAIKLYEQIPEVEIYLKTTVQKNSILTSIGNIIKHKERIFKDENGKVSLGRALNRMPKPGLDDRVMRWGKYENIVVDTRYLSFKELIDLYNSAHCFLLPTFGEGWGLTLCEAMATGAPCIATPITGSADFFDGYVGFPIGYDIHEFELENYNLKTRGYIPRTEDMVNAMEFVRFNYDYALRLGEKASYRIRNKFTWEQSARRLYELVKKYTKSEVLV